MDSIKKINLKKANGIYNNPDVRLIKSLINGEKYSFDYFNIILDQQNNTPKINIVSPNKYYESYIKLGKQPDVPADSNENQIISFYSTLFKKYQGLTYDENTFLYKGKTFNQFETEVMLLSSLINKSNTYKDFDKPYASIEFYVNTGTGGLNKTITNYHLTQFDNVSERKKYLKRFVNTNINQTQIKKTNFVKNYKKNEVQLYRSFEDPKNIDAPTDESIFEINIPSGSSKNLTKNKYAGSISNLLAYKDTCNYDIVGFVITKTKADKTIKRVYILNDIKYSGTLKLNYFDSQIIENKNYSYKIEQINNIHGFEYTINNDVLIGKSKPFMSTPIGKSEFPKDSFIEEINEPSIEDQFSDQDYSSKEEEIVMPFYRDKPFSFDSYFFTTPKQMVAYSPISDSKVEQVIPDIVVETVTEETPPSTPDISIYSTKGESKKVLILLSNLIAKQKDITGIVNIDEINVIDLGASVKQKQFKTKELRVFRIEDKPTSYESFSKTPRKILDPDYPDFVDPIEPNTIYYYYADAVDSKGQKSDPSKVLKFQMVEEQNHVFPLLEVYDFAEDRELVTEKIFRKRIRIVPTFLQSTVGKNAIVGEYIKTMSDGGGYTNKLFGESKEILFNQLNPSHKIRVTSKKTRRRFDINTIFSYVTDTKSEKIPDGAILVLEEELPKSVIPQESIGIPGTKKGSFLKIGDSLSIDQYIQSPNGEYIFYLQGDGNAVIYKIKDDTNVTPQNKWSAIWSTKTANTGGQKIVFQNDGNLVLYDTSGKALWSSKTTHEVDIPQKADELRLDDIGNLVLYNKFLSKNIWSNKEGKIKI